MKHLLILTLLSCLMASPIFAQDDTLSTQDKVDLENALDSVLIKEDSVMISCFDYNLDSMVHNWFLDKALYYDCGCYTDTIVRYPDSVYIYRLQQLPYAMEMPFNSIVRSYIEMYAKRKLQVGNMLGMGENYYFPLFEEALSRYNVPLELRYLPVIESALNARAVSRAGAGGLWQFMVRTGKDYGLEVNSLVDERCDPIKSTDAAARYLRDLYSIYGDWSLVIAAYNCGPGNVAKAIRYAGGKKDYWSIYPYLPRETRGYVPIFIAANYIMNYYSEHNICPSKPKNSFVTDTIMISDRVHLAQISEMLNISIDELRFLNPQYRRDIIPGNIKQYPLVLPFNQINAYSENRDSILAYKSELVNKVVKVEPSGYSSNHASTGNYMVYRVKSGDTLGRIASRYKVSVRQIQHWNNLHGTMIKPGQRLKIHK